MSSSSFIFTNMIGLFVSGYLIWSLKAYGNRFLLKVVLISLAIIAIGLLIFDFQSVRDDVTFALIQLSYMGELLLFGGLFLVAIWKKFIVKEGSE